MMHIDERLMPDQMIQNFHFLAEVKWKFNHLNLKQVDSKLRDA